MDKDDNNEHDYQTLGRKDIATIGYALHLRKCVHAPTRIAHDALFEVQTIYDICRGKYVDSYANLQLQQ